ncbi:hypothetical protein D9M70_153810 [compost metagenome]
MEQPRLADPGLPHHRDDLPVSGGGLVQRQVQRLQFGCAAHEAGQAAVRCHLQARAQCPQTKHFIDRERLGDAFELGLSQRLELEVPLRELVGGFAHENGRGRGHRLHPRSNVDRVPHRVIVGVQVVLADRAHDYLARVDAHPDLQRDALLQPQLVAVPVHCLLHAQRRVQRALGMVLMGDGRAEQREDAVAQRLGHVALVVMHGLHHQLDDGGNQAVCLFRVPVVDQCGRARHVGKQHGDGLAFAGGLSPGFQRRLLGPDALGQVRWSVMNGGGGRGLRYFADGLAASVAEARRRAQFVATARAEARQPVAALLTKIGANGILKPANCAARHGSLPGLPPGKLNAPLPFIARPTRLCMIAWIRLSVARCTWGAPLPCLLSQGLDDLFAQPLVTLIMVEAFMPVHRDFDLGNLDGQWINGELPVLVERLRHASR